MGGKASLLGTWAESRLNSLQWTGCQILVTGGAGFVGSHLVEALVGRGAYVTVVDNLSTGRWENLVVCREAITVQVMDILEPEFTDLVAEGRFAVIFHLAANPYVPPSVEDPVFDYRNNLMATFQLLETLRKEKSEARLVYASSAAVYGNPIRNPIHEKDPTVPISPYGVSKLAAERYAAVYAQTYGLRIASARLFSTYGPRQHKQVIYDLVIKLQQNPKRLFMYGDGTQRRDFNYVTDAVAGLITIAERAKLQGEVYNVGSGRSVSILEIAHMICRQIQLQPEFVFSGEVRPGDPGVWVADISRLTGLGYRPAVPLEEGVAATIHWIEESAEKDE